MIDTHHALPVSTQVKLLDLSRSSVYYRPLPVCDTDLKLMRRIDEIHLEHPFAGSRMLRDMLRLEGHEIGRKHVGTLMKRIGIQALYRKQNTSRAHPQNRIYPYLLRGMKIDRANQVWAMDMTYIPMARGFVYLSVVMDWASRKVLAWRLSNTMTSDAPVAALEEAIARYGAPQIMNTDQGSQFTSADFIGVLESNQIQISMDGKGCWRDNVFVERLWRSIKYENVYLHAYATVSDAKAGIGKYLTFFNEKRPHSSLDGQVPDTVYFDSMPPMAKAA